MAANDNTRALLAQIRSRLTKIEDEHTRQMVAAWAHAWDDVSQDLAIALNELALQAGDGHITRSAILKSQRLANGLNVIEQHLNALFTESGTAAVTQLHPIVDHAGRTAEQLIGSQLPASERRLLNGWDTVDPNQVKAIAQRTTEQITKTSFPLASEATANMKRELVRGLIGGQNPRVVAAKMLERTEGLFNGGLSRALTIARTEMLDAHRAGAMLSEQANKDVLQSWTWSATLSSRTCPACWGMDGMEFPLEQPGPDGHQNCRCVRVPNTKSWRDLGIKLDEPPSLLPDAEATFNGLDRSEQLAILGPSRFNAWRAGNYPMDSWAEKRTNSGWRDSYVPSKAPAGGVGRNKVPRSGKPTLNGGGGGAAQPPKPPAAAGDGIPPIGTVLKATGGNKYVLPGETRTPRHHGHNPDWDYEFISEATHRMTAMLQYYFESEKIVKHVARNILDGNDPLLDLTKLHSFRTRKATLLPGYTVDDLKQDALAAGTRLAKMKDVDLGIVYRGIAIDADATDLLQRYTAGHTEAWSYSSATKNLRYAEGHGNNMPGRTKVIWFIQNARGQILRPVGRMATIDERLINGQVQVLRSQLRPDGVVEVYAKWLKS